MQRKDASFGAHHKNLNEDSPILSAARLYSPVILLSGDIRFVRIFAGYPEEGASNDSGVVDNSNFQRFRELFLRKL